MSTNSTDFRRIINLIESTNDDSLLLKEGPLLNRGLAKLGSNKAQGRVDRDQLAKPMIIGFRKFLGRTNRSGTFADVQAYLTQIGFNADQAKKIVAAQSPYHDDDENDSNQAANSNIQSAGTASAPTASQHADATSVPTDDQDSAAPDSSVAGAADQPISPTPTSTRTTASASASAANPIPDNNHQSVSAQQEDAKNKFNAATAQRDQLRAKANAEQDLDKRKDLFAQAMKFGNEAQAHRQTYNDLRDSQKSNATQNNQNTTNSADQTREKVNSSYHYSNKIVNELFDDQQTLDRQQINAIFTSAAAYAHDNNLVKSRVGKLVSQLTTNSGSGQSNPYGGYNNTTGSTADDTRTSSSNMSSNAGTVSSAPSTPKGMAQQAIDTLHTDMFSICKREGMSNNDIQKLKDTVKSKSRLAGITDENQMKLLSLIGFAFLKTTR